MHPAQREHMGYTYAGKIILYRVGKFASVTEKDRFAKSVSVSRKIRLHLTRKSVTHIGKQRRHALVRFSYIFALFRI